MLPKSAVTTSPPSRNLYACGHKGWVDLRWSHKTPRLKKSSLERNSSEKTLIGYDWDGVPVYKQVKKRIEFISFCGGVSARAGMSPRRFSGLVGRACGAGKIIDVTEFAERLLEC